MAQAWSKYSDLTRIFISTALATGLAAIFNLIFLQWALVILFAVVSLATGIMAKKKMNQEDLDRQDETGPSNS